MRLYIILFIFFFSEQASSRNHTFNLSFGLSNITIDGTFKSSGAHGVIASNNSLTYAFDYIYTRWRLFAPIVGLKYTQYKFEDDAGAISGEKAINSESFFYGFQTALTNTKAIQVHFNSYDTVAYKLRNNAIELFYEKVKFPSIEWHQILYIGRKFVFGAMASYHVNSSSELIRNRGGYGAELFLNFKGKTTTLNFKAGYEYITLETDDFNYEETQIYGLGILKFRI